MASNSKPSTNTDDLGEPQCRTPRTSRGTTAVARGEAPERASHRDRGPSFVPLSHLPVTESHKVTKKVHKRSKFKDAAKNVQQSRGRKRGLAEASEDHDTTHAAFSSSSGGHAVAPQFTGPQPSGGKTPQPSSSTIPEPSVVTSTPSKVAATAAAADIDTPDHQAWMAKADKLKKDMKAVHSKLVEKREQASKKEEKKAAESTTTSSTSKNGRKTLTHADVLAADKYCAQTRLMNEREQAKKDEEKKAKRWAERRKKLDEQSAKATNVAKGYTSADDKFIPPAIPIDEKTQTAVDPSALTSMANPSLAAASPTSETLELNEEDEKQAEIKYWVQNDESLVSSAAATQEDISNITIAYEEHTLTESTTCRPATPDQHDHGDDVFVEVQITPPPVPPTFDEEPEWVKLDESAVLEPDEGDVEVMDLPPAESTEHNGTYRRWYRLYRREYTS